MVFMGLFSESCRKSTEPQPIEEKKFVQIYCDAVMYADLIDSKLRQAFVDSVLNSHQVTRDEFQHSIASYSRDKKTWKKIFEKIVAALEEREKAPGAKGDSLQTAVQSIKRMK